MTTMKPLYWVDPVTGKLFTSTNSMGELCVWDVLEDKLVPLGQAGVSADRCFIEGE